MGVSINVYAYFGIKINWNSEIYDEFEKCYDYNNKFQGLDHAFDSMCGEYQVLGVKLFDSGDFRYGCEQGDEFAIINREKLNLLEAEYKEKFCAQFPQFAHIMQQPFEILVFTHYS